MSKINYQFSGNITFDTSNDDRYERMQALYASQNYGTFYMVYANFVFNQDNDVLETINLIAANYKGDTNLGFMGEDLSSNDIDIELKNGVLYITLAMKGMAEHDRTICDLKGKNYKKADITGIYVYRELREMYPDSAMPSNLGHFDSEFYYREAFGIVKPITPVPLGLQGYPGEKFPKPEVQEVDDSENPFLVPIAFSDYCEYSILKVI